MKLYYHTYYVYNNFTFSIGAMIMIKLIEVIEVIML